MDSTTPTDEDTSIVESDRVRKFTPKLVQSKPEEPPVAEDDIKHKADMLGFLSEIMDDITEDRLEGLIAIMVFKDGTQSEVAMIRESDYAILGRMHVASATIQETITYGDDDADNES